MGRLSSAHERAYRTIEREIMMNKMQLDYAVGRLKEIAQTKYDEAKEKHTKKGALLTAATLVAAIKSGKVKPRNEDSHIERYTDVGDTFDLKAAFKPDVLDKAAYDKAIAPITAEFNRIRDNLVLGDAAEALKLIEAFAAKRF